MMNKAQQTREATHTTVRQPSLAQMRSRCLSDHVACLRAIRLGRELQWSRSRQTAFKTLRRWGCVEADGTLSDIGNRLADLFDLPRREANGDGAHSSATRFDSVAGS